MNYSVSHTSLDPLVETHLSLAEVLSSLSYALDLTSGQAVGHAQRACLIAMRLAREIGLPAAPEASLYQAMLLKDAGCSSNAARMFEIFGADDLDAKRAIRIMDWSSVTEAMKFAETYTLPAGSLLERAGRIQAIKTGLAPLTTALFQTRCSRGAQIARNLGLGEDSAQCIYCLDEHWDGCGAPHGLRGDAIPLLARIACLAQTLEVFVKTFGLGTAYEVVRARSGRWFDPELARAAHAFRQDDSFWRTVADDTRGALLRVPAGAAAQTITPERIDGVCEAFAQIVDAKSHFTGEHSTRVQACALSIAEGLGATGDRLTLIRRAALLHDIGKLAVPNTVLDKPGPLDATEWKAVRQHPLHTRRILSQITGFARLSEVAAAHHERLDGSGYCNGLRSSEIDQDMRILAVADVWDALSSHRPYREAMETEQVLAILDTQTHVALDPECVAVLKAQVRSGTLLPPVPPPVPETFALPVPDDEDDLLLPLAA